MGMRRGYKSDWLMNEEHTIGVNLGADFCAEHEWGIEGLMQTFGIENDESIMGIERYRIRTPKDDCVFLIEENKNNAALIVVRDYDAKYLVGKKLGEFQELSMSVNDELVTAWCKDSLGIRVKKPKNIKKLKQIHKAIMNREAAIWLGGGWVFQNAGLVIGIIKQIPEHLRKEMYDVHIDRQKLKEAAAEIDIRERIDAFNEEYAKQHNNEFYSRFQPPCGYLSLSPKWLGASRTSKYRVMYWLNPRNFETQESGYYTVEELELWMKGEGPVFKKKVS